MIALVTLRFGSRPYFDVSGPQLDRYAARHGYVLHVSDGSGLPDDRDRRWAKVPALLQALGAGAQLVLYLDADCVILDESQPVTNLSVPLAGRDLLVGRDSHWNANTGVMLATARARDILEAWHRVPTHDPETASRWPVDELGFNRHVLPAFKERISVPARVVGTPTDLVTGPWIRHLMNGTPAEKRARMQAALASAEVC